MARVVIGVQLVIAGFQLPAKFLQKKWLPMFICLIPIMTIMWLFTTGCILLTVPNLTLVNYNHRLDIGYVSNTSPSSPHWL